MHRHKHGFLFGTTPFGYRRAPDHAYLVVDGDEERVVAVIRHMYASGMTLREIVIDLTRLGIRNRRGRPFGLSRVWEILHARRPVEARRPRKRQLAANE